MAVLERMMSDDFETSSVKNRLHRLGYQRQLALTDLAEARATDDYSSGAEAAQTIANLDAEKANLIALYNRHIASNNPPPQIPQTAEEWRVKSADRMTPQDGLEVARRSKYGANLDWNDPGVRAGYQEMMRRRQTNENQG
jgi:hypothetical protein